MLGRDSRLEDEYVIIEFDGGRQLWVNRILFLSLDLASRSLSVGFEFIAKL